jgi:hypothetical protein
MGFEFLADLSLEARRELHAKLSYELREKASCSISVADTQLWDAVRQLLPGYRATPLSVFLTNFGQNRFQEARARLDAVLIRALPKNTRRPIRQAVTLIIIQCLIDYLRENDISLSAKSVLGAFEHLEYAVDLQYPGYIECQLMDKVVRRVAA